MFPAIRKISAQTVIITLSALFSLTAWLAVFYSLRKDYQWFDISQPAFLISIFPGRTIWTAGQE